MIQQKLYTEPQKHAFMNLVDEWAQALIQQVDTWEPDSIINMQQTAANETSEMLDMGKQSSWALAVMV